MKTKSILVWDIPTRLFHWLLVICFAAQWITSEAGENWMQWHFYIGYFTLGLILFRILWGIVGSKYAKFSAFVPSITKLKAYFNEPQKRFTSHNPIGAMMVFLLLALFLLQAVSGLFTTDDILNDGPLRHLADATWQKRADFIHANVFTIIQIAVALHMLGVLFYLLFKKQNLVKAMFTGKKSGIEDEPITSNFIIKGLIVAIVVAALMFGVYELLPEAPQEEEFFF